MVISEKNLFDYIFFPDTLLINVREEIQKNPVYRRKVEFFRKLKADLGENVNIEVRKKLARKITLYKSTQKILLEFLPDNFSSGNELGEEIKLFGNKTEGIYMILSAGEKSDYMFLFSVLDFTIEDAWVVFRPSGTKMIAKNKKASIPGGLFNETINVELNFDH